MKATAQVSFNIAECEERMGRLAAAVGDYRVAAKTAEGDPKAKDVYAKCGDKIAAIEPRVPKLTITRGSGADSATIELDGVELGVSQLGTEIPVDPGPHVVVGKIGDKVYFRQNVTLEEKEAKPIDVVMKVSNTPIAVDEPKADKTEEPPPEKPRSRTPGIVIASAGAVSMGIGFVFFAMSQGKISDLNKICGVGQTSCPPIPGREGCGKQRQDGHGLGRSHDRARRGRARERHRPRRDRRAEEEVRGCTGVRHATRRHAARRVLVPDQGPLRGRRRTRRLLRRREPRGEVLTVRASPRIAAVFAGAAAAIAMAAAPAGCFFPSYTFDKSGNGSRRRRTGHRTIDEQHRRRRHGVGGLDEHDGRERWLGPAAAVRVDAPAPTRRRPASPDSSPSTTAIPRAILAAPRLTPTRAVRLIPADAN